MNTSIQDTNGGEGESKVLAASMNDDEIWDLAGQIQQMIGEPFNEVDSINALAAALGRQIARIAINSSVGNSDLNGVQDMFWNHATTIVGKYAKRQYADGKD